MLVHIHVHIIPFTFTNVPYLINDTNIKQVLVKTANKMTIIKHKHISII